MPRFPFAAGACVVAATVAWAVRLAAAEDPFAAPSALLVAADALLVALVVTAGLLLARGRWARYAAAGLMAAEAAIALFLPRNAATWAVLAAAVVAAGMIAAPPVARWVRRLPAAGRPDPGVVALALVLLVVPGVVGLAQPDGPGAAQWVLAGVAPALAWGYARAHVWALWALRLVFPPVAAIAALTAGWAGAAAIGAAGAAVSVLAWRREARLAAVPLTPPRVATYRIPPELAPAEVLEAAGLDAQGRRVPPQDG